MSDRRFADRAAAGRALAVPVARLGLADPVVLALPRGGVPVGAPVAAALGAPLDVLVACKVGAPGRPELGVGAVAEDGPAVFDQGALRTLGLTATDLALAVDEQRAEVHRRLLRYRGDRPPTPVTGRSVVVVDDGLATGVTARAALHAVRRRDPGRLVLAAPVASREALRDLSDEAEVLAVLVPDRFGSVSRFYDDFSQLTDDAVLALLDPTAR